MEYSEIKSPRFVLTKLSYLAQTAELIGIKIFLNEFVAYEDLSAQIVLRESGTVPQFYNGSSDANWIDERSEAIVTYALCGFANVGSIGIMLGGLSKFSYY